MQASLARHADAWSLVAQYHSHGDVTTIRVSITRQSEDSAFISCRYLEQSAKEMADHSEIRRDPSPPSIELIPPE